MSWLWHNYTYTWFSFCASCTHPTSGVRLSLICIHFTVFTSNFKLLDHTSDQSIYARLPKIWSSHVRMFGVPIKYRINSDSPAQNAASFAVPPRMYKNVFFCVYLWLRQWPQACCWCCTILFLFVYFFKVVYKLNLANNGLGLAGKDLP